MQEVTMGTNRVAGRVAQSPFREGERPREPKLLWESRKSGLAGTLAFPFARWATRIAVAGTFKDYFIRALPG
jgi:hypothetical protein